MKYSMALSVALTLSLIACSGGDGTADLAPPETGEAAVPAQVETFSGAVVETMNSGGYTYVLVDTGSEQLWAASNEFEVAVDDRVMVPIENPMADFHSDTLDRTFDLIYFASQIVPEGATLGPGMASPTDGDMMASGHAMGMSGHTTAGDGDIVAGSIDVPEGGLTVGQVWADRENLADQNVIVRGKVVKFNGGIMGTNWIHIQDGTGSTADGTHDLTVTAHTGVAVGDIVTITGPLTIDKDFGAGYRYAAIVMDAEVTK